MKNIKLWTMGFAVMGLFLVTGCVDSADILRLVTPWLL